LAFADATNERAYVAGFHEAFTRPDCGLHRRRCRVQQLEIEAIGFGHGAQLAFCQRRTHPAAVANEVIDRSPNETGARLGRKHRANAERVRASADDATDGTE